jgi:hypothetical protein
VTNHGAHHDSRKRSHLTFDTAERAEPNGRRRRAFLSALDHRDAGHLDRHDADLLDRPSDERTVSRRPAFDKAARDEATDRHCRAVHEGRTRRVAHAWLRRHCVNRKVCHRRMIDVCMARGWRTHEGHHDPHRRDARATHRVRFVAEVPIADQSGFLIAEHLIETRSMA